MSAKTSKECIICTENFTKKMRKPIACPECQHSACLECYSTFFLGNQSERAVCMQPSCNKEFSLDFLASAMGNSFITKWRKHRTQITLMKERQLLPTVQAESRLHLAKRRNRPLKASVFEELEQAKREVQRLQQKLYFVAEGGNLDSYKIDQTRAWADMREMQTAAWEEERRGYREARGQKDKNKTPKSKVTLHCTVADCDGFVTSLAGWKCGLCTTKICKDCHIVLTEDEHVCNEADKASAELIRTSSKACPGCSRLTTKISGCYQMWCPACHTAWDWNTREIDDGLVHNALGAQWLRDNPAAVPMQGGGNCCGNRPLGYASINRVINSLVLPPHSNITKEVLLWTWNQAFRLHIHMRRVEIPHWEGDARLTPDSNRDLRVRKLSKEITDSKWESCLLARVKKREKASEYAQAFRLFSESFETLGNNSFENPYTTHAHVKVDIQNLLLQSKALMKLADYFNQHMRNLYSRYKNQYPQIIRLVQSSTAPSREGWTLEWKNR